MKVLFGFTLTLLIASKAAAEIPWALVGIFVFNEQVQTRGVWHRETLRPDVPEDRLRKKQLQEMGYECTRVQAQIEQCRKWHTRDLPWSPQKVLAQVLATYHGRAFHFARPTAMREEKKFEKYREWDLEQQIMVLQGEQVRHYQTVRYAKLGDLIKVYPGQNPAMPQDYLVLRGEHIFVPEILRQTLAPNAWLEWSLEVVFE